MNDRAVNDRVANNGTAMMARIAKAFTLVKVLESVGTGWFATTYMLFLLDSGLTQFQANCVNVVFMTTIFLFDPFTGSLGDNIGQKKIYILGLFFWGSGMLVYFFSGQFLLFILAEFVGAIGYSLMSDALESWLRNHLGEDATHSVKTRTSSMRRIVSVVPAFIGSIVASKFGLRVPWILSAVTAFVGLAVSVLLLRNSEAKKPQPQKVSKPWKVRRLRRLGKSVSESINLAVKLLSGSKELRFIVVLTFVTSFSFQAFNMFWSPIISEMIGDRWWSGMFLGLFWIGIALSLALGSYIVRNRRGIGKKDLFFAILVIGGSMLIGSLYNGIWMMIPAFLVHEFGRSALDELGYTYRNRYIPDDIRTSANSLFGSVRMLAAALGLFLSGLLTNMIQPVQVWIICSVILLILALYIVLDTGFTRLKK